MPALSRRSARRMIWRLCTLLVLGGLLPPLYAAADLAGGGATGNVFEVLAGLRDGGYLNS